MYICDTDHEEICYDDHKYRECPICVQIREILDETGDQLDEMKAEIASLESELRKD